jgi:hypothetical protein
MTKKTFQSFSRRILILTMVSLMLTGCGGGSSDNNNNDNNYQVTYRWSVRRNGNVLEISYGRGTDFPQYAALHLDSGYFRMIYGPDSGWGTSVILIPAFWSGGVYYQGTPVTVSTHTEGKELVVLFEGTISGLDVNGRILISPPANNSVTAMVSVTVNGDVVLDNRPGEAFKPVMLSSMHISSDMWDAESAYVDSQSLAFPQSGWIVQPVITGSEFGVKGGTSTWKTNAPTVGVILDREMDITGWVTESNDPNDDNVGLWAASDTVLDSWGYTITARKE